MARKKQTNITVTENISVIKLPNLSKQRKQIEESKNIGEIPFMTYEIIRNRLFQVK